jgi:hypothetical protein
VIVEDAAIVRRYGLSISLGLASLVIMAFVLPRLDNPELTTRQNAASLAGWLASLLAFGACVLLAVRWRPPHLRAVGLSLRSNWGEALVVVLLFLVALGLRVYKLDCFPYPVLKDEFELGTDVLRMNQGRVGSYIQYGWSETLFISFLPEALSVGLLGNTVFAIRLAPAILGALSVVLLYFLARVLFDRQVALLAAICLLGLPPHLHFSRLGINNIVVCLWAALIFWLTVRAIRRGQVSDYLWAGLVSGLPFYSYLGSRLVPALAAGMLGCGILFRRGFLRAHWRALLVYAAAMALVLLPVFYFSLRHPEAMLGRVMSENIFSTRWLVLQPVLEGRSAAAALLDQLRRSTLVFVSEGAHGGFFFSPQPYLTFAGSVFFLLGLAYSVSRLRELRYFLLNLWFWSVVVLGSVIFANAPSNERIVGSLPAAAILCAVGLVQLAGLLGRLRVAPAWLLNGLAIGVMALSSLQGVLYYFGDYQRERLFAHVYEEFELEVSLYVGSLRPGYRLYLLTEPPLEASYFPAHDYLIPEVETRDLAAVTAEGIAGLPRDRGLVFAAIPVRVAELEMVARLLPGGQWLEVSRQPIPGQPAEVLYYAYRLAPGSSPSP